MSAGSTDILSGLSGFSRERPLIQLDVATAGEQSPAAAGAAS